MNKFKNLDLLTLQGNFIFSGIKKIPEKNINLSSLAIKMNQMLHSDTIFSILEKIHVKAIFLILISSIVVYLYYVHQYKQKNYMTWRKKLEKTWNVIGMHKKDADIPNITHPTLVDTGYIPATPPSPRRLHMGSWRYFLVVYYLCVGLAYAITILVKNKINKMRILFKNKQQSQRKHLIMRRMYNEEKQKLYLNNKK